MNLQTEPVLTPLQQEVYDYFKTKKKVPYQKALLQKKLGISTPAVLTKSINALIKHSLLTLEEVKGETYLMKVEVKKSKTAKMARKTQPTIITPSEQVPVETTTLSSVTEPFVQTTEEHAMESSTVESPETLEVDLTTTTSPQTQSISPMTEPSQEEASQEIEIKKESEATAMPSISIEASTSPTLPSLVKYLSEDAYALIWYLIHKTEDTSWDLKEIAKVHPLGKRVLSAHEELYIVKIAEADVAVDRFKTHLLVERQALKPLLGRIPFIFRTEQDLKATPKDLILSGPQQCLLHYIYQSELKNKTLTLNHKEQNLADTGLSKLGLEQAKRSLRLYHLITMIQRGGFNYFQITNTGKLFIQKHAEIYQQPFQPLVAPSQEELTPVSEESTPSTLLTPAQPVVEPVVMEPVKLVDPHQELKQTLKSLSDEQMATYRLALTYANEHPSNPSCHFNSLMGKFQISSPEATNKALTLFQSIEKTGLITLTGKKKQHVTLTTPVKVLKALHPDWFSNQGKRDSVETLMPIFNAYKKKKVVSFASLAPAKITHPQADFKSRTYLIDTENIGTGVEASILNQLTKEDTIVFLLSQHSRGITAEQLHAFINASCKLESWMFEVRGKGESDLDHALVVELTLRLVAQPETQFVVLSKDQGYLAAFRHLRSRLNLKEHQLILTATF